MRDGIKPARRRGGVDLDRLVRRHGDLPVYWCDFEGLAGESDTRNWCEAVDVDLRETTVADVVRGYRLRPMPEALRAIRRVVRDRASRQHAWCFEPPPQPPAVDLDRLVRRHGDLPVYWCDLAVIACESGTRNWCAAVDVDPQQTTVAELVRGYRLRPMTEALKVIRRVSHP